MAATETLYPSAESDGSEDLKIVRIARHLRGLRMTQSARNAHISVVGYMSSQMLLLDAATKAKEQSTLEALLWNKREKLVWVGVPEEAVVVYEPYQVVPIQGRMIVLTAHESSPAPLFPKRQGTARPIQPLDGSGAATAMVITDPEKKDATRTADIELTVWESETTKRVYKATTTFTVGPDRFEEVAAELTVLSRRIKAQNWGAIKGVNLQVKVEGAIAHEAGTMNRLLGEWKTKAKASLVAELDLHIPATAITGTIEVSLFMETEEHPGAGGKSEFGLKPGVEVKVILLRF